MGQTEKVASVKPNLLNLLRFCGNSVTKPGELGLKVMDSQVEGAILPTGIAEPDPGDTAVEV